jgi:predicted RNA-binding protein associated with RNAse of E/G family
VRYEYRRAGKASTWYEEWLIVDRPDVKVLLLDRYDGHGVQVEGADILDPGAPIVWCVFPGRWYDVGRFHRADGSFTGWYTNFCRPPVTHGARWMGDDLFLDLWQPAQGGHRWLDEDELDEAARGGFVDAATRARLASERRRIAQALSAGEWPPAVARNLTLTEARALARR